MLSEKSYKRQIFYFAYQIVSKRGEISMDFRQQRTRKNIINAFLTLRSEKSIEKITIKELAEKAKIHKATFYLHYHDIYELSESLEKEVVEDIIHGLSDPACLLTNSSRFNEELYCLLMANESMLSILFSGNRSGMLSVQLEKSLKEYIFERRPEWNNFEINVILTYLIQGAYHAYMQYRSTDSKEVLLMINQVAASVLLKYTNKNSEE